MAHFPHDVCHNEGASRTWIKEIDKITEHVAANGITYTDEDIERWGKEAEDGFPGWKFGKPVAGRPISVGVGGKAFHDPS